MTIQTFRALGLSETTLSAIAELGFETPTAVQIEGVPAVLGGRDVIIQAQTGTGKTAAFVWPAVEMLEANPGTVEILVLTPTRELAQQVSTEFQRFGAPHGIHATAIYGGSSFQAQYDALDTAQAVVATPGRLLDLLRRKKITLRNVRFFGLDEADEMLSMGFEKDVLDVISNLPDQRQSFLCSATINDDIMRVGQSFIRDPITVDVSSDQIGARNVRHEAFKVSTTRKLDALRRLIHADAIDGALIFANTRAATFRVTDALVQEDVTVDVLNGDLSQSEREAALARMKADKVKYLVATDVAARGIDISGLPAVVNYDMPESPDVYIHRTGRTGRAGQAGVAYSLVSPGDIAVFHALEKFYKLEFHPREIPTNEDLLRMRADSAIDEVLADLDAADDLRYGPHIPLAQRLAERPDGIRVVAKLIAHFAEQTAGRPAAQPAKATPRPAVNPAEPTSDRPATTGETRETRESGLADDMRVPEHTPPTPPADSSPRTDPPGSGETAQARRETQDTENPRATETSAETEAPRRTRRRGATGEPPTDQAPATRVTSIDADALLAWLSGNPGRRRGRWRSSRAIADALGTTAQEIEAVARDDARIEESRKEPGRFRTLAAPDRRARTTREGSAEASTNDQDTTAGATAAQTTPAKASRKDPEPKPKPETREPPHRPNAKPAAATGASQLSFAPLRLNAGESRIQDPEAFKRLLVECAGLDIEDLGELEVHARHSILNVREDYSQDFVIALQDQTVDGVKLRITRPRKSKK